MFLTVYVLKDVNCGYSVHGSEVPFDQMGHVRQWGLYIVHKCHDTAAVNPHKQLI